MVVEIIISVVITILMIYVQVLDLYFIYYFFRKYLEKRKEVQAYFELGLALFFLMNMVGLWFRLIFAMIFVSLAAQGQFVYSVISVISLIILMFVVEHQFWKKKTRYVITIVYLAYLVIVTIIALTTQFQITFVTSPISYINLVLVSAVPIAYFYLAGKSTGELRTIALAFGIGFAFILLGGSIQPENVMQYYTPAALLYLVNPISYFVNYLLAIVCLAVGFSTVLVGIIKSQ
ncbi:MAG: hypothetical protein ACTSRW_05350 [Candidatus Helarchaeota archaeon]